MEAQSRASISEAQAAVFFLDTVEKIGILSHQTVFSSGIPSLTIGYRTRKSRGLSPFIKETSTIIFLGKKNFGKELPQRLSEFLENVAREPEGRHGLGSERIG